MSTKTWRGVTVEERREDQRTRLLVAGCEVFAARGYAGASVEDIVAGARVSRTAFYRLFENKEECLLAVFWDAIAQLMEAIAPILAAVDDPPEKRVYDGARTLLERFAADPALARVVLIEIVGATRAAEQARTLARRRFAEALAAQLGTTSLWEGAPEGEIELVAFATMAGVAESIGYLVVTDRLDEWESAAEPLTRYALRALAPGEPPEDGWA